MTHLAKHPKPSEPKSLLSKLFADLAHAEASLLFYKRVQEHAYLEKAVQEEHDAIRKRIEFINFLHRAKRTAPETFKLYERQVCQIKDEISAEQARILHSSTKHPREHKEKTKKNPEFAQWHHFQSLSGMSVAEFTKLMPCPSEFI